MKISFRQSIFSFLCLFSTSLFAQEGHVYLGGSFGATIGHINDTDPIIHYYNGDLTDFYPIEDDDTTTVIGGANIGYEFVGRGMMPAIALGLGLYGTPDHYGYSGDLIETATGTPPSTLYDFGFGINNIRLMAEAQFTWFCHQWTPFINVGVGASWNRMEGYEETPDTSDGFVALPPFENNTETNFAYQAGFGIGYAFGSGSWKGDFNHERISVGYRYVSLGDAEFETRGDVYPYGIDIGDLSANEIYLSYIHLF